MLFVSNSKLLFGFESDFIFWDVTWAQLWFSVGYLPTQMHCLQAGMLCSCCTLQTAYKMWIYCFVSTRSITFFLTISFFCQLFTRYDVSEGQWVRCNVHIQTMCHYPVFGLKEGSLYQFRVCAINKAGVGRPSNATEPIRTVDPLKHTRTVGKWWTDTKLPKWL